VYRRTLEHQGCFDTEIHVINQPQLKNALAALAGRFGRAARD
jgi:hypothetical protein